MKPNNFTAIAALLVTLVACTAPQAVDYSTLPPQMWPPSTIVQTSKDHEPASLFPLRPYYSLEAYRAHQQGDVTLRFDINIAGVPMHIQVINSTNSLWFNKLAIDALSKNRFNDAWRFINLQSGLVA
jgi:TonB family protein